LTQTDIDLIRALHKAKLPVILVLTKTARARNPVTGKYAVAPEAEALRRWLENPVDRAGNPITIPVESVILTAAVDQGKFGGPKHGLSELVAETLTLSPEDTKDAFRVAQRLSLTAKAEVARNWIMRGAAAAAAAAAVPIPVADAAALAPIQLGMMGRIAATYGLEMKSMLSAPAFAQLAAQIVGKALARSFVKLIPGAGHVLNATVAAALTLATGEAWRRVCEGVYLGKIDLDQIDEAWRKYAPTILEALKHIPAAKDLLKNVKAGA